MPVADGPYKFCGLPGLIIRVGDTRQHYVFELRSLRKPAASQLALPTKVATPTTKAAFNRALADFSVDPVGRMSTTANNGAGIIVANPEEARQKARERARNNNNPLELK